MKIYHDSRNAEYRSPFGAVTAGTEVRISADVSGDEPESVRLMLWKDEDRKHELIEMKRSDAGDETLRYSAVVRTPDEGCLLWYAFEAEYDDDDDCRTISYYGNNVMNMGGVGQEYYEEPERYQITVYRRAEVPSWYTDGIVYQIFPDRFARDEKWHERCEAAVEHCNGRPGGQKRLIQEDWTKAAYYVRDDRDRVTEWPLYGGSFAGIEKKLDYLRSLGVTCIYLNPVFESVSNHHYDTADYMKTDMSLGSEEEFVSLLRAADGVGIRIILDGVFSHTGRDSVYFDYYRNYEEQEKAAGRAPGAYHNEDSPYRSWYKFDKNEECGYKSWWGVEDLPEVNEENEGFRKLITGEDGVIDHWMKKGVSGWRLDVADELPDSFIRDVRARVKKSDPDGLLIGEVWEDASNKISYGVRRRYFMGDELDGTMNYPLRTLLLDYINYSVSSGRAGEILMSLAENYPKENFYAALNLIGSHDRERIITAMAAEEDYESAVKKVRLLSALQYSLPGVPCIYYGDEAGLMGWADPQNRSGFPWGFENLDLGYHYRMLGLIYDEHPVLKDGSFTMLSGRYGISDDVFAFMRGPEGGDGSCGTGEKILVLANRSYGDTEVDLRKIPGIGGGYALELLRSKEMEIGPDGFDEVITMSRLSCKIICILPEPPEKEKIERSAGVICHISSLGKGALGTPAKKFVDFIASAGMRVWQILPLNMTGLGDSPYSSIAAFAGETDMINRDELPDLSGLNEFCAANRQWLAEYVAYMILRERFESIAWQEWPAEYRDAGPEEVLEKLYPEVSDRMKELVLDQYYFCMQWKDLKEYANGRGISIMGDLPMYMASDSADVWANKELFRLDENGRTRVHSGVPPDVFSKVGQDWGNPLYDWEKLRETGYAWWLRRMRQCAERYDILRIDHFRGLSEYYAIPEGGEPADGAWQHSAGLGFFRAVKDMLRKEDLKLSLLAEDLGFLDDGVKDLLMLTGLPGMDIWQFTAHEMMSLSPEKAAGRAFYTGTHDNDTLMGFVREKILPDRLKASGYYGDVNTDEPWIAEIAEAEALDIISRIYESEAVLAVIQLQDMFMLGSEARMNVPGVAEGNWGWKISGKTIEESFPDAAARADWFRTLAEKTGR